MSLSYSKPGKSNSFSQQGYRGLYKPIAKQLQGIWGDILSSGSNVLSEPLGPLNMAYKNLFGDNPQGDYLGARGQIEDTLSGRGVSKAFQDLMPALRNSISTMNNSTLNELSPLGVRFSSDVLGLQSQRASDILDKGLQDSIGFSLGQGNLGLGVLNQIADLSKSQMASQIPLLMQFLAQMGKSRGMNNSGMGISASYPYTGGGNSNTAIT